MKNFIETLKKNLEANGFPTKKVGFNIELIYEKCDDLGFSFNSLIPMLNEQNIDVEIQTERIVFSQTSTVQNSPEDMQKKAQDMMKDMDPAEIEKIQKMYENMSQEEKDKIMEQAKKMGLF